MNSSIFLSHNNVAERRESEREIRQNRENMVKFIIITISSSISGGSNIDGSWIK